MSALAVLLELPAVVLAPLACRLRGHHWHTWTHHAASSLRICIRCGRTD